MEKRILILMATYNGSEYLTKQIESIRKQSNKNWKLLIRDDGSTDGSLKIIKDFSKKDTRINYIVNHTSKHGAYLNFWTLIKIAKSQYSNYDYYFFADQDDIWLPNKINNMILFAENSSFNNEPLLVYADMAVIDARDKLLYPSLNKIMGIGKISGYSLFFAHGYIWGCDIMLNQPLFNIVPDFPLNNSNIKLMSHDNAYGKWALITGKILFLNKCCIYYRRHGNNVTDKYDIKLSWLKVIKKIFFDFKKLCKTNARVYMQSLLVIYQMNENGVSTNITQSIKKAINLGGVRGFLLLKKLGFRRKQVSRTISTYLIMLLGLYKKYLNEFIDEMKKSDF